MNPIERASISDLEALLHLKAVVVDDMTAHGIRQWSSDYPRPDVFERDLKEKALYVIRGHGRIIASVTLREENDPAYRALTWQGKQAMVIHRLMVDPHHRREGFAGQLFAYAEKLTEKHGCDSIKVDTHPDNYRMLALIRKHGYREIGYIASIHRIGFEKILH